MKKLVKNCIIYKKTSINIFSYFLFNLTITLSFKLQFQISLKSEVSMMGKLLLIGIMGMVPTFNSGYCSILLNEKDMEKMC